MTIADVITLMSEMKGEVSRSIEKVVRQILALAMEHSYLGGDFAFEKDADLDREVNRLLVQLSDEILDATLQRANKVVDDEDRDEVIGFVMSGYDGKDSTERMDQHSSNLKYILGAYLALSFGKGYDAAEIYKDVFVFLADPRDAVDVLKFGKGMNTNIADAMTVLAQNMINTAFQHQTLLNFRKETSVIGYKVNRASSYDCPICDELCVGIHPLDEEVLPAHPRCCCYMTPVYAD